jgi:hypothetical protein
MELYLHPSIRLHGVVLNELNTDTTLPLPFLQTRTSYLFNIGCYDCIVSKQIFAPSANIRVCVLCFSFTIYSCVLVSQCYSRNCM